MERYSTAIEESMRRFYKNLSEKNKRHYGAIEALKLGHGGIKYISRLFGCCRQTISKGMHEIEQQKLISQNRSRQLGGGRKSAENRDKDLEKTFLKCD